MVIKGSFHHAIGKRKSAVARVFLKPAAGSSEGSIKVNGLPHDQYFGRKTSVMVVEQPLKLLEGEVDSERKFDIVVNVCGGGLSGQAGAVRHGISRALLLVGAENRPVLKKVGYLTRDAREVERKKYGRHKARKRPQFSKR
jgi:small subunit ribosomal protein S9